MFCKNCNAEIQQGTRFCQVCGKIVSDVPVKAENKQKNNLIVFFIVAAVMIVATAGVVVALISINNKNPKEITTTSYASGSITDEELGSVRLTADLQYNINVFLSNFSETGVESFETTPSVESLAYFSEYYNYFNRYNTTVEWGDYDFAFDNGGYYANYRIKEEHGISAIKKYFGLTVEPGFAEGCDNYANGYFYGNFTGAHHHFGFSIVSELNYIGDGIYEAFFDIYDSGGEPGDDFYPMNAQVIEACHSVTKVGSGSAKARIGQLNDRLTYTLVGYDVTR